MALWLENERRNAAETIEGMVGAMGHSLASHYRWKAEAGGPGKPGPKGPDPDVLSCMLEEVEILDHVKRRTWGTDYIYQEYESIIPKNVIQRAIEEARKRKNRIDRAATSSYEFVARNIAWSEDFIEVKPAGKVLRVQDDFARLALGSEHRTAWTGGDVSRFLDAGFRRYGKPYFFKHDWGSEFRNGVFQAFLRGNGVISFPSPPYSPWYNGKMERQNGAVRFWLASTAQDRPTLEEVLEEIRLSQLDNNLDRRKDVLGRRTPEETYAGSEDVQLDRQALYKEWDALKEKLVKSPGRSASRQAGVTAWDQERPGEFVAMRLASIILLRKYRLVRYTSGPEAPEK